MSPAVSPSPQDQSPSPSPSGHSPSPLGVSPSPLDQSPSPSPTKVRVGPDLSPDSSPGLAWTHESNGKKVLYSNPTIFAEWLCILSIGRQHKFPSFLYRYRKINCRKYV